MISTTRPDFIVINNKKRKRTCKIVYFAELADQRKKLKESKRKKKRMNTSTLLGN